MRIYTGLDWSVNYCIGIVVLVTRSIFTNPHIASRGGISLTKNYPSRRNRWCHLRSYQYVVLRTVCSHFIPHSAYFRGGLPQESSNVYSSLLTLLFHSLHRCFL